MKLIFLENDGTPAYAQSVPLEGVTYRLRIEWNDRAARWYFSVLDATDDPIVAGICMVVSTPLLDGTTTDFRRPPGDFFLVDTAGLDAEAGLTDLGVRHLLYYVQSTELPTP